MRVITHRTIQKLHAAAALTAFVDEEQLMHIVPGQTIWGRDEDLFKGRQSGPVAQPIQPWALELGPAIAVIAVDMLLGQMPVGLQRDILAQARHLLLNRLRVLLPGGGDPDIEGNFHDDPPDGAMGQDPRLLHVPWPIAEGTGRHNPTVVDRRSVRPPSGAHARMFSWVPPASRESWTQEDTLVVALAAEPLGTSPPGQREDAPAGAAEFVICDHTIELFHKDVKMHLGFEDVATSGFDAVQSHVHWVYCAYILLHMSPPGVPADVKTIGEKQRRI